MWKLTLRKFSNSATPWSVSDELSQVATFHLGGGSESFFLPATFNRDTRVLARRLLCGIVPSHTS